MQNVIVAIQSQHCEYCTSGEADVGTERRQPTGSAGMVQEMMRRVSQDTAMWGSICRGKLILAAFFILKFRYSPFHLFIFGSFSHLAF